MANSDWMFNDLSEKISGIQTQKTEVEGRLAELDRLLEALELIRPLYKHNGVEERLNSLDTLVSELKQLFNQTGHKNQMNALLTIASRNGGHLKVNGAKKIMIEAGLIRTPKNAATVIYALISRSEKFEWVVPGEYRLIGTQQSLLGVS